MKAPFARLLDQPRKFTKASVRYQMKNEKSHELVEKRELIL
jgi:hypothetical protein